MEITDDWLRYKRMEYKGKIPFLLTLDGWTQLDIVQDCNFNDEFFRCVLHQPDFNPLSFTDVKHDNMDELVAPYENITLEIVGPYRWKLIRN